MTTPHPINQAVIAQALHDLRNGQLRRCKTMGFADEDLAALKEPGLISVLLNARVPWCTVQINRGVLQKILGQAEDVGLEIASVDRMLHLGASTEMVSQFYGLTHQEVALRRNILGLPKRKGRHQVLSEAQDTLLWERWHPQFKARKISVDDDRALLDLTLDLAEELSYPASVVWASLRDWINQGLV
ncbi:MULTISPECIES: DUF2857 domain-containing protein [unclassified Pseudomonas]|uniref:DUF2857 domain-containing protein n=1 Tax=unclassified Pseudomonas TaxID=196821 RepID=UPI0008761A31|nr:MULTISPECIES: DUF2857 domain-containing protein [unclassified Pseudomonas]SCZ39983.1 Protein of unknown function [Pseudomonas sp. NFACC44-2]SDA89846.1 Protein of unknown function [Pseudomonas sp. NFACC51]SDW42398.1 Protein of unknown function [Pseudomonas sp. NFACC08-1]SFI16886.1 Protein of unknown function [Pseudomonas sp. NFACC54]SFT28442.1 Protein of unknown function [Pseudomonas sp. NFACC48-1]